MKKQPEPVVELGKFIPLAEFKHPNVEHEFYARMPMDLYLPTQVVVYGPELVMPRVARVVQTTLKSFDGKGWTMRGLDDELFERKRNPSATSGDVVLSKSKCALRDYPSVWLYEVWADEGDRGQMHYSMLGYVYVSDEDYPVPMDKKYPQMLTQIAEW